MTYKLCGHCLHSASSHEPHNGHFMYCAVCMALCETTEFNQELKPTDFNTVIDIMTKREYSKYTPREVKQNE
jgi:transcription elongation factor Elf1